MFFDVTKTKNNGKIVYQAHTREWFFGNLNTQYDVITINGDCVGHNVFVDAQTEEQAKQKALAVFTDDYYLDEMGRIELFIPSHKQTRRFMSACKKGS